MEISHWITRAKTHAKWFLPLACLAFVYYSIMLRSDLPTDEEMIEHFHSHRVDIEELIRRYRSFTPENQGSHHTWMKQGDTPELMKKAGVDFVDHTASGVWLTNPYSLETGKEIYKKITENRGVNIYLPQHYGELDIKMTPEQRYSTGNLHYVVIWKWLVFFPEEPKIVSGKLIGPTLWTGKPSFTERVEHSLNLLPFRWREYGCAYRKIEAHWFLKICNGH